MIIIVVMNPVGKKSEFREADVFAGICSYLALIERQENVLQAHREAITTRHDFHPLTLFNYVSRGEGVVTRKHLLQLTEECGMGRSEEEMRVMMALYGYKEKMDFAGFLNFIYPSSIEPLKYISTVGLKRYAGIPMEEGITEEIVCLCGLLFGKEAECIQQLQNMKVQHFPRLTKHQIKRILKLIKKKGESKSYYELQSENVVTFNEMRGCLRRVRNLSQAKINVICRRLSMGKDNFVSLEQMETWLKGWARIRSSEDNATERSQAKTLLEDFENSIC